MAKNSKNKVTKDVKRITKIRDVFGKISKQN